MIFINLALSSYERLMEDVVAAGANTKMLLLSATPVNNELSDLRNPISFIAGGDVARNAASDRASRQKLGIASVKETTRKAHQQFTIWSKRPIGERKTRDLIAAIGGDFIKLLDGLSIARSRQQIANYYAEEISRLGGFPVRAKPKALHPQIDLAQKFLSFEQLDSQISELTLALYHLSSKLRDDLPEKVLAGYKAMS